MPQYQITLPHTEEECMAAINTIVTYGTHLLNHAWFGCDDNVHFGWLNVEANTDLEARGILPPALRAQAQVVEVRRYTPEEAKGGHS